LTALRRVGSFVDQSRPREAMTPGVAQFRTKMTKPRGLTGLTIAQRPLPNEEESLL
jgi:hypothetical protein